MDFWENILKEYDEIVHIPMSSGLSGSCQTAMTLADDYDGKVHVVDNQRTVSYTHLDVYKRQANGRRTAAAGADVEGDVKGHAHRDYRVCGVGGG